MRRWWRPGREPRGVLVIPRALTLGSYVDALLAAGIDDGATWDAGTAPADACLDVLNVLCDRVDLPGGDDFLPALRSQASEAWGRMVAERDIGREDGERLRKAVEYGFAEGFVEPPPLGPVALIRHLSVMPPTERAAALAEPLRRSFAVLGVSGIAHQLDKVKRESEARVNSHLFN